MPKRGNLILSLAFAFAITFAFAGARAEEKAGQSLLVDVGGYRLNTILLKPRYQADLPPIVFIHGASASLYDPMFSFREKLEGKAELLFIDRPGHGASDIGGVENTFPDGQADAIAKAMDKLNIPRAIIVSHSFGGAVAAALALNHPDKVLGLVFLSPAVYPWEGGIAWYNRVAATPVIGWLFSGIVVPPAGLAELDAATRSVFAPNRRPDDYIRKTRAYQALRPAAFHHNAEEIINLRLWAKRAALRYPEIHAPTFIVTGDADQVVSPEIHAFHLARDIRGSRLIVIHNLGHKSDYVASDIAIAAIYELSGYPANLRKTKVRVEARISAD